jgi:hypothetical protein
MFYFAFIHIVHFLQQGNLAIVAELKGLVGSWIIPKCLVVTEVKEILLSFSFFFSLRARGAEPVEDEGHVLH